MMQVSGRNLNVYVGVLIYISTIELHSESSANMFHILDYFCTVGSGVM